MSIMSAVGKSIKVLSKPVVGAGKASKNIVGNTMKFVGNPQKMEKLGGHVGDIIGSTIDMADAGIRGATSIGVKKVISPIMGVAEKTVKVSAETGEIGLSKFGIAAIGGVSMYSATTKAYNTEKSKKQGYVTGTRTSTPTFDANYANTQDLVFNLDANKRRF